jgi:hypothetical protein
MSTILSWLNKLLAGCGVEPEKQEAYSIIHSISEAYSSGSLSEEEMRGLVSEVCEGIVSLASRCGRSLATERCVEDLMSLIKKEISFSSLREKIMKRLRSRSPGATRETASIL